MVTGTGLVLALVGAVAVERILELALARRNAAWAFAQGAVEHGRAHYPWMVALHVGLLVGSAAEPLAASREFNEMRFGIGVAVLAAAQVLRGWTIMTLGRRWTTRVVVLPGRPLVTAGPFRFMRHPNYVAVAVEVAALPLACGAWGTAIACSVANGVLMAVRIPCEEAALGLRGGGA